MLTDGSGEGGEGGQEKSTRDPAVVRSEADGNGMGAPTQDGVFLAHWSPRNVFSGEKHIPPLFFNCSSTSAKHLHGKIINAIETTMDAVLGLP